MVTPRQPGEDVTDLLSHQCPEMVKYAKLGSVRIVESRINRTPSAAPSAAVVNYVAVFDEYRLPVRDGGSSSIKLQPTDAVRAVIEATSTHRLVAIGERHLSEPFHDFLQDLLPELPDKVDDIVVEFGNALHQDVADRFVLNLEPVEPDELAQIWRTTIGGRVYWDAPVYQRFFRSVRDLNAGLEPDQRIRVVLGDPPVDWSQVDSAADRDRIQTEDQREPFFAGVVDREVMARGRRALLLAGGEHLRRARTGDPAG